MSLKAKLEAVIYASEEPVTLAQLASLFAAEALEWKEHQDAAAAKQAAVEPPLPMVDEGLQYLGLDQTPAFYTGVAPAAEAEPSAAESAAEAGPTPAADGAPAESPAPEDPESEAKRAARVRDREVKAILRQLLDQIIADYDADDRGVEIREIAGGFRMATKPECHDAVRLFIKSLKPALKLSLPALETLAVVAYKQPVTAPEVNDIRGVESGGVLGSLLSRKLIATAGRKQVIGRPILYKTTKEFLLRFGLKDVSELPSMEEFEKMAAVELSEEAAEGEADVSAAEAQSGPEFDENAPEDIDADAISAATPESPGPEHAAAENVPALENCAESGTSPAESFQTIAAEGSSTDPEASNEHAIAETAPND